MRKNWLNICWIFLVVMTTINSHAEGIVQNENTHNFSNDNYTAHINKDNIQFSYPKSGLSWSWSLETPGSSKIEKGKDKVIIHRGNLLEQYILKPKTIEQLFIVQERPNINNDLIIKGRIKSNGKFRYENQISIWENETKKIAFGKAIAFDALGKFIPVEMEVHATSSQIIIKKEFLVQATFPITIDPEIGDEETVLSSIAYQTKPASAFNTTTNEVLVLWTEGKSGCASNIELKSQKIDFLTGNKIGSPVTVYAVTANCESSVVEIPEVSYDPVNNQYFAMIKTNQGGFKKVVGFLLNANGQKSSTAVEFVSSTFGDPYKKLITQFDPVNQKFIAGYHVQVGASEMSLHLQLLNPSDGQKQDSEVIIDKNTTNIPGTSGPKNCTIDFNSVNSRFLLLFHVEDATSSEIWGVHLTPSTLDISGSFFQVSPNGTAGHLYKNPTAAFNPATEEYLVSYEDVELTTTEYDQVAKIYGQKIAANSGAKVTPNHVALSQISLTGCGGCVEQAKLPVAFFSPIKNEFMVSFYGVPTSSGLENYHIYSSRIDPQTLGIIDGASFKIAENKGTTVITNKNLQAHSIEYLEEKDKFLYTWLDNINSDIVSQIRKYRNHAPTNLNLAGKTIQENLPINTLVGNFSTTDLDEGDQFTYTLVSGQGSANNASFKIAGNELLNNAVFNYETTTSRSIRIRTTDSFGEFVEKSFTIEIENQNESPTNITLDNNTIQEYLPVGSFIGRLSASDPDQNATHEFTLTSGTEYFEIKNDSIITNAILQFDQSPSFNISVKAIDNGGLEFEKNISIIVEEYPDFEEPVIVSKNFKNEYPISKTSEEISIEATDDTGIRTVKLYHKKLSDKEWTSEDVNGTSGIYSTIIEKTMLDETGVVYFFEVSDFKHQVYSDTVTMTIVFEDGDVALGGLDFGGKEEDYQIIAIPYQLSNQSIKANFEDDLGIQDDKTWRTLHFGSGECCAEYPTSLTNFERGKGYWFNQKNNNTIGLTSGQVAYNPEMEYFEINLEAGWNQIGNPFPSNVNWTDVISFPGNEAIFQTGTVSNSLYLFSNGNFNKNTLLPAFRGAFISAEEEAVLKIPVSSNVPSGGRTGTDEIKNPITDSHWEVTLNLISGNKNFTIGGLGMHPEASISKDRFDELLLPRFGHFADYHFNHPEYFYPQFARDIVPTSENHRWEFTVTADRSGESQLEWDNSYFGESRNQLLLVDLESGVIADMGLTDSYHFDLSNQRNFQVLYGNEKYIAEELAKLSSKVGLPYPNPFNENLKIPVLLPSVNEAFDIHLNVYNNLGAEVYSNQYLFSQNSNIIQWDGRNNQGENTDTGIYFYKVVITNTGNYFTGKVVKH